VRATRGVEFRQQPTRRFGFNVRTSYHDGNRISGSERVGTAPQGYLGPVIDRRVPYITTTSRADFMAAFNKRANYHSSARIDRRCRGIMRTFIRRLVPTPMPKIEWDVELYRRWLDLFDSEKRARMEKAYASAGLDTMAGYSSKQIFTKIESLVKDFHEVAPRVIFKGTDFYNMISGPMFKELMDRFVQLENNLEHLKFRVSYRQQTPEIVSFLEARPHRSWIEADFSSNDKTQVADVVDLEIMFMRRLGCPEWFLKWHRAANKFSVHNTKYGLSAVVENQLPSGSTDGTFRNSFWNLCILNTWMVIHKVPSADAVILGDDMLAGLTHRKRRASRTYRAVSAACHMDAKVTTHPCLHNCHFLSKHFIPVCRGESSHVMLPYMGKVLAKFNCRPNSNANVCDDEYMAGKALSHCFEFRHCHVLRDMFRDRANFHLARSGGKFSVEGVTWHVRVHSAYADDIAAMLGGSMDWPDLVTRDDLSLFWIGMSDLVFSDLEPLLEHIILGCEFDTVTSVVGQSLVDY
jgi:hypothetical protein